MEPEVRSGEKTVMRFVVVAAVVVALLVGMRFLLAPDHERPNWELFPDMFTSPAVESQSRCEVLPGGLAQQPLVAGVVPRGSLAWRVGPGDEERERAGRELRSPFAADAAEAGELDAARVRGAEVYRVHCTPCHGVAGDGKGSVVARGMLPPPSLGGAGAVGMRDGAMFHLVTHGRGNMAGLGDRMSARDRWSAVLHVRELQAGEKR